MALACLRFCSTITLLFIGTHYTSSFMPSLSFLSSFDGSVRWKSGVSATNRRRTHLQFQLRRCVKCCLTGGLKTLAPGHLAPDGPGRHTELSPHHGVKAHASLHIIYLAEDFWGCFFICSTSCLSHLVANSGIQDRPQNYVAESVHFFHFFSSIPARCLLWHAIPSHKQQGPEAYPSCSRRKRR